MMMMLRPVLLMAVVWLVSCQCSVAEEKTMSDYTLRPTVGSQRSIFLTGNLGTVDFWSASFLSSEEDSETQLKFQAHTTLKTILRDHWGATGDEEIEPSRTNRKAFVNSKNSDNLHIHFQQSIDGLPIEGTAMVMHLGTDGSVVALNGEFLPESIIDRRVEMDCETAVNTALEGSGIVGGAWLSDCVEAAVLGNDGLGYKCWKRTVGFKLTGQPPQRTILFASAVDGHLLTQHPLTRGARKLETRNCGKTTDNCRVASNSSDKIATGDAPLDAAHNSAIDYYDFLLATYGRDSLDGQGMTLISQVHYDVDYSNAFWDGEKITYGDGDGKNYRPFSLGLDVVAHELTHGITQYASNLNYFDEPGAINEALSDVMAAVVDRVVGGKDENASFTIGEDIPFSGKPFRNMSDPAQYGGFDYYPDRYRGSGDYGGVHVNSGIVNLAFSLMTRGGIHPRGKTTISVAPLLANFTDSIQYSASLFYSANVLCLTPSSNFRVLRDCTILFGKSETDKKTISDAWDAVGVTAPLITKLMDNSELSGQSEKTGDTAYYALDNIQPGETVTCLSGSTVGDADLYVRFGALPDPYVFSTINDCLSAHDGSDEICTTGRLLNSSTAYVAVNAWQSYSELFIKCFRKVTNSLPIGTPLTGQSAAFADVTYYIIEGIEKGEGFDNRTSVTCQTSGNNGDADLYLRASVLPDPFTTNAYDCASKGIEVSNERCTLLVISEEPPRFYVAVVAVDDYSDLTIQCDLLDNQDPTASPVPATNNSTAPTYSPAPANLTTPTKRPAVTRLPAPTQNPHDSSRNRTLEDGQPLTDQWAASDTVTQYRMNTINAGGSLNCSLTDGQGDRSLFVKFGSYADPFKPESNDCYSVSGQLSQACTTEAVLKDTDAFVAVSTVSGYTGVTIACSRTWRCYTKDQPCQKKHECCPNDPSNLRCIGPKASRVCTPCRKRSESCQRTADCCSTNKNACVNGTCKKKGGDQDDDPADIGLILIDRCKKRGKMCRRRKDCCKPKSYAKRHLVPTCKGPKGNKVCNRCRGKKAKCSAKRKCCKKLKCQKGQCRTRKQKPKPMNR